MALLVYWKWFFTSNILVFGDWRYVFPSPQRELWAQPYLWSNTGVGGIDFQLSFYFTKVLWGLLGHFANYAITERILYLWLGPVVGAVGAYLMLLKITKSAVASLFGSLVYSYNTYPMFLAQGHLTLFVAYQLAPLLLFFILSAATDKRWSAVVAAIITACVMASYDFRMFYIISIAVFLIFIFFWIKEPKAKPNSLVMMAAFYLGVFIFNFFWINTLLGKSLGSSNPYSGSDFFGTQTMGLAKSLTLFHPSWNFGELVPFKYYQPNIIFYLLPIYALIGLIGAKNEKKLIFLLIAIIGIFLGKETASPGGQAYTWLYSHLPGFSVFRESSKFYLLTAIGYSFLIALSVDVISKWPKRLSLLLLSLLAVIPIAASYPLVTTHVGAMFEKRVIPSEYIQLSEEIHADKSFGRVLWIPGESIWSPGEAMHPSIDATTLLNNQVINECTGDVRAIEDKLRAAYKCPEFPKLLESLSVSYIIVPLEDGYNKDLIFPYYRTNRTSITSSVDEYFKPYRKSEFSNLEVYYLAKDNGAIKAMTGSNEEAKIIDEYDNPTSYTFSLQPSMNRLNIQLSQSFNQGWTLEIGNKLYKASSDKYGLTNFEVKAPGELIEAGRIYFAPQAGFEKRFYYSLLVFGAYLAFLVYLARKQSIIFNKHA